MLGSSILPEVNYHQPESRMRENRSYGSEGGGTDFNRSSLPLSKVQGMHEDLCNPHRLDIHELADAVFRQLPAVTAPLDAAKGEPGGRS